MSVAVHKTHPKTSNKNIIFYVHVCIFLLITFGIGFLPPFAQITETGMRVLGAFLGAIYGWLFIGMGWPGFVALIALGISGYVDNVQALFVEGFSFYAVPIQILCFIFADAIAKTSFTDYVASKLLSMNILVGRPYILMGGCMFITEILILVQAGFAGLFLMWSLFANIAKKAGYAKHNTFCNIMIPATLMMFILAEFLFPFKPGAVVMIGLFQQGTHLSIPFINWVAWFTVFTNIYIVLWTLLVKYILRPDFSAIADIKDIAGETGASQTKMTSDQKFGLSMLIFFIGCMFLTELLPAGWAITQILNRMGLLGVLAMVLAIMSVRRTAEGESFLNLQRAAGAISWDSIWLLVAVQPLASAFGSNEIGIMPSLMSVVSPILANMTPALFLVACTFVLGLITQFSNNFVLMVVFIPLLCPMYESLGGNPFTMLMCLIVILNTALATPAASYTAAIMFGNDQMEKSKAYVQGITHFFFCFILLMLVGAPLANVIF